MKFREIASRLTGISSPIFGVWWNPPAASERRAVLKILDSLPERHAGNGQR